MKIRSLMLTALAAFLFSASPLLASDGRGDVGGNGQGIDGGSPRGDVGGNGQGQDTESDEGDVGSNGQSTGDEKSDDPFTNPQILEHISGVIRNGQP